MRARPVPRVQLARLSWSRLQTCVLPDVLPAPALLPTHTSRAPAGLVFIS